MKVKKEKGNVKSTPTPMILLQNRRSECSF